MIVVRARPRVLGGIRTEDFSGFARGDVGDGHVIAINVGDAEIANLQKLIAKPNAVGRQLRLERVQLAQAAAVAGAYVDSAIVAPNIRSVNARFAAARRFKRDAEMGVVGGTEALVRAELDIGAAELHVWKTAQGHGVGCAVGPGQRLGRGTPVTA